MKSQKKIDNENETNVGLEKNFNNEFFLDTFSDKTSVHDMLLKEFDQAWEHYRHIEDQRSKLMSYFYTMILGITALAVNTVKDVSFPTSKFLFIAFSTLLFIFFYYTFFTYTSVKKSSMVLRQYENIMNDIRKIYYKNCDSLLDLYVRNKFHKRKFGSLFSFQRNSEVILLGSMIFMLLLQFLLIYFSNIIITDLNNFIYLNGIYLLLSIFCIYICLMYSKSK